MGGATQSHQFGPFGAGQALPASGVDVVDGHPPSQARRAESPDPFCDLDDRRQTTPRRPRPPIYPDGTPRTSRPSPGRSTAVPARPLAGRHRQRLSTSSYCCRNKSVLRPLVALGQYTSWVFGHRLHEAGLLGSMGRSPPAWTTRCRSGQPCSASCSTPSAGKARTSSPGRPSSGSRLGTSPAAGTQPPRPAPSEFEALHTAAITAA
jgi:hypothetical protein